MKKKGPIGSGRQFSEWEPNGKRQAGDTKKKKEKKRSEDHRQFFKTSLVHPSHAVTSNSLSLAVWAFWWMFCIPQK